MSTPDGISGITLRIECEWGGFDDLTRWYLNNLRGNPQALVEYIFENSLVLSVSLEDRTESPANPAPIQVDRGDRAGGRPPSNPPAHPS
jgi:hypothetical protein